MINEEMKELYFQGKKAYESNDVAKAKECFKKVIASGLAFADMMNIMGFISSSEGNLKEASYYFEKAVEINPAYTDAWLNLSVTYNEMGEYDKAKGSYQKAMEVSNVKEKKMDPFILGKLANMHFEIAEIYHGMGLFNEAVDEYLKALNLRPTFADIRTKLGIAYRDNKEYDKAVNEFEAALKDRPAYIPAKIQLGLTYFTMGNKSEAEKLFKEILSKDPENKNAMMYLNLMTKK